MNLTTLFFLIFSNILLATLSLGTLSQFKGKIWLKIGLILCFYIAYAIFLNRIWSFNIGLFLLCYVVPSGTMTAIVFFSKVVLKKSKMGDFTFIYYTVEGKELLLHNPFRSFAIFGGNGSGKTKSIIKPTIENMARLNFAGIIYDYKKFDISRCAFTQYSKHCSSVRTRFVNFFDVRYSNFINPILPEYLPNNAYILQTARTLFKNLSKGEDNKSDSYFEPAAESVLAGIILRLKLDYPQYCTLPHVIAIITSNDINYKQLANFLCGNDESAQLASPFIQITASEKTAVSITSTLATKFNILLIPELFYVLSKNDFSLDLNNPKTPTLLCISNYQALDEVFSPIIATIISVALKQMNVDGKHHSAIILEEGATLKIPGFDNTPATARENKIASFFLAQDMVQIEAVYGKVGKDKLLSNLNNQFYGLVRDPNTAAWYSKMFGKIDKVYKSTTRRAMESSSSETTSTREVDMYPPETFMNLDSGQFCGVFVDSNHKKINAQFRMYDEPEHDIPMIHEYVKDIDVRKRYDEIRNEVRELLSNF